MLSLAKSHSKCTAQMSWKMKGITSEYLIFYREAQRCQSIHELAEILLIIDSIHSKRPALIYVMKLVWILRKQTSIRGYKNKSTPPELSPSQQLKWSRCETQPRLGKMHDNFAHRPMTMQMTLQAATVPKFYVPFGRQPWISLTDRKPHIRL